MKTTNTNGCPYCAHVQLRPVESFAELHPELMEEYDVSNTIDPVNVFPNSKEHVTWKCKNDASHKWPASFLSRHRGHG